jgi:hypothetical protein
MKSSVKCSICGRFFKDLAAATLHRDTEHKRRVEVAPAQNNAKSREAYYLDLAAKAEDSSDRHRFLQFADHFFREQQKG